MPYHYSDPKREAEPTTMPDVEIYWDECAWETRTASGFYYAFGFPGCLWDSDPVGPFDTEAEALEAARDPEAHCGLEA